MKVFARRGGVPEGIAARAALPRGETVLARARALDGTWLLGTRRFLVVVPSSEPAAAEASAPVSRIPWEQVEDAGWDQESSRLQVTETGTYGEQRPTHAFDLEDPALLLQLVRERVTASIVLQRWVPVRDQRGLSVIGRRSPVGGPITWMHAYDPGLDPEDPDVVRLAEAALTAARAEAGESEPNPI